LLAIADRACLLNDFALAMPPLLAFAMLTNITRKHSAQKIALDKEVRNRVR
jgi:hypothetical protein